MTQKLFLQDKSCKFWSFRAGRDLKSPKVHPLHFTDKDIEVLLVSGMIYHTVVKWPAQGHVINDRAKTRNFSFISFLHSTKSSESLLFVRHGLDFLFFSVSLWYSLDDVNQNQEVERHSSQSVDSLCSSSRKGLIGGDVKTVAFGMVLSVILDYLCQIFCMPLYYR